MAFTHTYLVNTNWTGNTGSGTAEYGSYERDYRITIDGKTGIDGSSDPAFRGNPAKVNPEELLVASLSSCHMLWYLHLCAVAGVIVVGYRDEASGTLEETPDGSGRFTSVTLRPEVIVKKEEMIQKALELHTKAHLHCFIANSCNFPITHLPTCTAERK